MFWKTRLHEPTFTEIAAEARKAGLDYLKPIYIALGEKVPYDLIRLVVAHLSR